MPFSNSVFILEDHNYFHNNPFQTPGHNNYYNKPQLTHSTHIHPQSAAGQLGLTPEELAPILHEQQEFLQNKSTQPPMILTRPTTTHWIPATEELGLTQDEVEEVLEDQKE
jgi:hypothetical protein